MMLIYEMEPEMGSKISGPCRSQRPTKIWSLRMAYKQYEVTRSVKLNKYPKHDANLSDRVRDIRQNHKTMKYRSL